ncbi:hypothetical protein J4466_06010 [Candidatus Pacearchaeota archaeon]|nr:hypothetical protein [Candidatus Pacearchaeota archaeon]
MEASRIFYRVLSSLSIILGILLILSIQISALGAVIGLGNNSTSLNLSFGFFFLVCGIVLLIMELKQNSLIKGK